MTMKKLSCFPFGAFCRNGFLCLIDDFEGGPARHPWQADPFGHDAKIVVLDMAIYAMALVRAMMTAVSALLMSGQQ